MLGSALEVLRIVSILIVPAMPTTAEAIWARIGLDGLASRPAGARLGGLGRIPGRAPGGQGRPALPPAQGLTGARSTMDDAVIEWFDSHCHLQDEFTESDDDRARADGPHATRLAATIARASEAGVTRMVCVGTAAGSSREAVALVRSMREPGSVAVAEGIELWATIGLHPHDAVEGVDSLDEPPPP